MTIEPTNANEGRDSVRHAFTLKLKPGKEAEYEAAHRAVWPEMLELLKSVGIREYSIFRRGQLLVLVLECADFEAAWSQLDQHPVNQRWQEFMAPLFDENEALRPGERFPMLDEVFFLA